MVRGGGGVLVRAGEGLLEGQNNKHMELNKMEDGQSLQFPRKLMGLTMVCVVVATWSIVYVFISL